MGPGPGMRSDVMGRLEMTTASTGRSSNDNNRRNVLRKWFGNGFLLIDGKGWELVRLPESPSRGSPMCVG